MIVSDRHLRAVPARARTTFAHGYTFGGHPVSAAVALANLDIFEREGLNEHVRANEGAFRATLEKLHDLPIVGDVRGDGYFYGIELVKDKATKETFDDDESERLLRGFLSKALFDAGLYCRADDRGDPVIQLAPPLISASRSSTRSSRSCARCSPRPGRSSDDSHRHRHRPARPRARGSGGCRRRRSATGRCCDAVLDAGLVAHVAVVDDGGQPYVVPVAYARDGDRVLFHGSTGSPAVPRRWPAARRPASRSRCSTGSCWPASVVRVLDALPRRRWCSARAPLLAATHKLRRRCERITEHLLPGRWADVRPPSAQGARGDDWCSSLPLDECVGEGERRPAGRRRPTTSTVPVWAGARAAARGVRRRRSPRADLRDRDPGARPTCGTWTR